MAAGNGASMAGIPAYSIILQVFRILGPLLTILYPAAASFEALESPTPDDDKQWLTYWVVNSVLQLFEIYSQPVIAWIPLYHTLKLVFVAWMVLPQFRGALYLYVKIFRPKGLQVRSKLHEQFGDQSHYLRGGVKKE